MLRLDSNLIRSRFLALCQAAKKCNDKDRLREDISDFINSDLAAFKLQHQSAALEKLSAQQNIEALRKKQDELQGQIEVWARFVCICMMMCKCLASTER